MKGIYTIVGMKHHGSVQTVRDMRDRTRLLLIRDKDNAFDSHAVEVWYQGSRIAFIKADEVVPLAQQMDATKLPERVALFRVCAGGQPQVEVED